MAVHSPTQITFDAPSEQIVYTVAEETGTEPHELPPLYHTIDPDAIDRLLTSMDHGEIQFRYAGHDVTVNCDGTVDVSDAGTTRTP